MWRRDGAVRGDRNRRGEEEREECEEGLKEIVRELREIKMERREMREEMREWREERGRREGEKERTQGGSVREERNSWGRKEDVRRMKEEEQGDEEEENRVRYGKGTVGKERGSRRRMEDDRRTKEEEKEGEEEEEPKATHKGKGERGSKRNEEDRREERGERITEGMRKETEKKVEERAREWNVVWRGVEGRDLKERMMVVEGIMERELGKKVGIGEVTERRGEGGRIVLIVEMERIRDKERLVKMGEEISRNWGVGVDEDLSMEERKVRWRMLERAKLERERGKRVVVENRRMWIEGEGWIKGGEVKQEEEKREREMVKDRSGERRDRGK